MRWLIGMPVFVLQGGVFFAPPQHRAYGAVQECENWVIVL